MKARACCLVFALIVAIDAAGGEVASSARSSAFAVDTEIVTNSTLIVDGSMLPFRLDYSPSLWSDETGGGGTARITVNNEAVYEATHDGTFLWNPSIVGIYSLKMVSANNVTIEKKFTVVAATVTIEREGYNLCKLTASDGVSEIRYTTDGTAPTADSPLYTGPFEVPPSRLSTVRAATFAVGCPQGEEKLSYFKPVASSVSEARANCTIDNSGETIMVGYDAIPLPYDTSWEGDSSSSMELRVDGNLIATRTGAGDVAWTPERGGMTTLTLRTINGAGGAVAEYSAQYDVVPRTVVISGGDNEVAPLNERYPGLCHWITNIVVENETLVMTRPGLKQAKFNTRFDTTSTMEDSDELADVSGVIAAYQKIDTAPWQFTDPATGATYAWNESNSTFAYFGEMYMEAGKTYVFGAYFDDDAYVKIDGQVLINIKTSSPSRVYTGSYPCTTSGWHEVEFRLGDNYGEKGSWGSIWSADFGLGYRDDGGTSTTQSEWKRLIGPGDGTLLRSKGGFSFAGCTNLKSVKIPWASLTQMRLIAPDSYDRLETIELTGTPTEIPAHAFDGCAALRTMEIPASVTNIGASAFAGCASLTSVNIPSGVTSIGDCAFGDCSGLTSVTMPYRFRSKFGDTLNDRPIAYIAAVRIEMDGEELTTIYVPCGAEIGELPAVQPREGYTAAFFTAMVGGVEVSANTVANEDMIVYLRWIPNEYEVTFDPVGGVVAGSGVQMVTFDSAYGVLPTASCEGYVFHGWFLGDDEVTAESVVKIAENCTLTARWGIQVGNGIWEATICDEPIILGAPLVAPFGDVVIPVAIAGRPVVGITSEAFSGNATVTSVAIPSSITNIAAGAFAGCTGIRSVYLGYVTDESEWMSKMFPDSYASITNVVFGDEVGRIEHNFFAGCGELTSVTLPAGLTNIIGTAFVGCSNIQSVVCRTRRRWTAGWLLMPRQIMRVRGVGKTWSTSPVIGDSETTSMTAEAYLAEDGDYTFRWRVSSEEGCDFLRFYVDGEKIAEISGNIRSYESLTTMLTAGYHVLTWAYEKDASGRANNDRGYVSSITKDVKQWGARTFAGLFADSRDAMREFVFDEGVKVMPGGLTANFPNVERIEFPSTLVEFGDNDYRPFDAEEGRDGLWIEKGWVLGYMGSATGIVTIPEGVKGIASYAFDGQPLLEGVVWPSTLRYVGANAFRMCTSLAELELPEGVFKVDNGAFRGCTYIQELGMPTTLQEIGADAFRDCTSLMGVTLPDGLLYIDGGAFSNCWRMMSVSIPASVESVGEGAFADCRKLTGVTVPLNVGTMEELFPSAYDKVTRVEAVCRRDGGSQYAGSMVDGMFRGCTAMESLVLPDALGEISEEAFVGCVSMAAFDLPVSVTNIGARAFAGLAHLTSFAFPAGVVDIGEEVFSGCSSLSSVALPKGLRALPCRAFAGCASLTEIVVPEGVSSIGDEVFDGCSLLRSVRFVGENAPSCSSWAYDGTDDALVTYVARDSMGWDGIETSKSLPEFWPDGTTHEIMWWEPNRFMVTFDPNGGDGEAVEVEQVTGTTYMLPPDAERDGAMFGGWWTTSEGGARVTAVTQVALTRPHTFYAHWTFNKYAVLFNANGGEGEMNPVEMTVATSANLPACSFLRAGYAFVGWATNETGEVVYADASEVVDLAYAQGASVTLYAVWDEHVWTMEEALCEGGVLCDGVQSVVSTDWTVDLLNGLDARSPSVRSGAIGAAEEGGRTNSTLTATVDGEGSGSFWWKVSCEGMDEEYGEWYDFAVFTVDGVEIAKIAGDSGWQHVEYMVAGSGLHTLEWTFTRDDYDEPDAEWENIAWVDDLAWTPAPKMLTIGDAASADAAGAVLPWVTGGITSWSIDATTGHVDGNSAKSGVVENGQSSWIEVAVSGAGTATFRWNVMGGIYRTTPFAYAKVEVDGVYQTQEHKTEGWKEETLAIEGTGNHTIRWTYLRTSSRTTEGDCAWLDCFAWSPSSITDAPSVVDDPDATVTGDAASGFTVKPSTASGAVEVTIPSGVDAAKVTVEVAPTVESVTPHGATIKIVNGGHDITPFLDIPAADGEGAVATQLATVKEAIVKETIDSKSGAEIDLKPSAPSIKTAPTRLGLTYTFSEGTTLKGMTQKAQKQGDGEPWTPTISVKGGTSGFYSIGVGK